jgi:hypothetical protein
MSMREFTNVPQIRLPEATERQISLLLKTS